MDIATVDLRGVVPRGAGWEAARDAVTVSMVTHGCVVVAHDALGADLRRALFSRALPEVFALPHDVKRQTPATIGRMSGYTGPGQLRAIAGESLGMEPTDAASIRAFTDILWPEGNPEFCETITSFAKDMMKLEEMVVTLVLEGLGARKESIAAYFDLLDYGVRMSHYGVPPDMESSMSFLPHYDHTMVSGIVQHEVEGLELQVGAGRWVAAPPETGTFTFLAGELFRVVTNGRVPACLHRVRTPSNRERFSLWFGRQQKKGVMVRALEDLVDAEHPLVFNPLNHEDYFKWHFLEGGRKFGDPLQAYNGGEKVVKDMA